MSTKLLSEPAWVDENGNFKTIFDYVYPVGSIYMSVSSTNPGRLFGGTWTAWGTGRVPVGINASDSNFSTVEKTGGESSHKLTISEMPSHNHKTDASVIETTLLGKEGSGTNYEVGTITETVNYTETKNTTQKLLPGSGPGLSLITKVEAAYGVPAQGGDTAHNNLQPYIVCYMWKRTA